MPFLCVDVVQLQYIVDMANDQFHKRELVEVLTISFLSLLATFFFSHFWGRVHCDGDLVCAFCILCTCLRLSKKSHVKIDFFAFTRSFFCSVALVHLIFDAFHRTTKKRMSDFYHHETVWVAFA